jgi:antitoxin HicB
MNLEQYLALPYHIRVVRDEDGDGNAGWVASVEELRGCLAQGDTAAEAVSLLISESMELWLGDAIDSGDSIPLPRPESSHSGKFLVRVPRGLHAALDEQARAENVTLNSYVATALAGAAGWSGAITASPARRRAGLAHAQAESAVRQTRQPVATT